MLDVIYRDETRRDEDRREEKRRGAAVEIVVPILGKEIDHCSTLVRKNVAGFWSHYNSWN